MRSRHFVAAVLAAAAVLSSVVESQSSSVVEALNCEQCFRTSSGAASRNVWCPSRRCAPSASACVSPSSFDTKNGCALADSVRACRRLSSTCQTRASVMTAAERDRASQVSEEDRRDVLRRKRLRKKAARKAAKVGFLFCLDTSKDDCMLAMSHSLPPPHMYPPCLSFASRSSPSSFFTLDPLTFFFTLNPLIDSLALHTSLYLPFRLSPSPFTLHIARANQRQPRSECGEGVADPPRSKELVAGIQIGEEERATTEAETGKPPATSVREGEGGGPRLRGEVQRSRGNNCSATQNCREGGKPIQDGSREDGRPA